MVKKGDHGACALNRDKMQAIYVILSFLVASWKSKKETGKNNFNVCHLT